MACSIVIGIALFLLPLRAWVQQTSSPSGTFSSSTELVLVPVSVRDHNGQPLSGLQASDFSLADNGKPQTMAVFEEIHASSALPPAGPDKLTYSNMIAPPGTGAARVREPLIIAIDAINTPLFSQSRAKKGMIEYLSSHLDAQQPTALLVLTSHGIRQVHAFTNDTRSLIAAAQKVQANLAHTEGELAEEDLGLSDDAPQGALITLRSEAAFRQANATWDTLNAFREIALAFAGIPGRKSLIWLSSGFPLRIDDPRSFGNMRTDFLRDYEDTWRALNKSEVAVYSVNLEALTHDSRTDPYGARARPSRTVIRGGMNSPEVAPRPNREQESEDSLRQFAGATGGRACINNTDIADCINKAAADSRDFYLLGFYVPHEGTKTGWHKLTVKLDKPHGELQARTQYFLAPPQAADAGRNETAVRNAAALPIQFSGVGFSVKPESLLTGANVKSQGIGERTSLVFRISVPASSVPELVHQDRVEFDLLMLPVSATGSAFPDAALRVHISLPPQKVLGARKNGLAITQRLALPIGSSMVKFVVLTQGGSVGSVFVPLSQE